MKRASTLAKDDVEILSNEEQQKVIDELKLQAESQTGTVRTIFYVLFLGIAIIFGFCLIMTTYYPWSLQHQYHFKDLVPYWAFQVYYLFSAYCFIVAALLVKDPTHSSLIELARYSGYAVGVVILLGWLHIFHKHSVTNPILFWLPIVDLAGLVLAQYVDFDSLNLVNSIHGMESLRYEHKSV